MRLHLFGALLQLAFCIGILVFCLSVLSQAATLSISGSAAGNGSQLFSVSGENITAFWNGMNWTVTGAF